MLKVMWLTFIYHVDVVVPAVPGRSSTSACRHVPGRTSRRRVVKCQTKLRKDLPDMTSILGANSCVPAND